MAQFTAVVGNSEASFSLRATERPLELASTRHTGQCGNIAWTSPWRMTARNTHLVSIYGSTRARRQDREAWATWSRRGKRVCLNAVSREGWRLFAALMWELRAKEIVLRSQFKAKGICNASSHRDPPKWFSRLNTPTISQTIQIAYQW